MRLGIHTGMYIFFSGIGNSSRDNKAYHNPEERLNLTTQPYFKLLSDDPYKAVSVAHRGGAQNDALTWKFSLKAHVEG